MLFKHGLDLRLKAENPIFNVKRHQTSAFLQFLNLDWSHRKRCRNSRKTASAFNSRGPSMYHSILFFLSGCIGPFCLSGSQAHLVSFEPLGRRSNGEYLSGPSRSCRKKLTVLRLTTSRPELLSSQEGLRNGSRLVRFWVRCFSVIRLQVFLQ